MDRHGAVFSRPLLIVVILASGQLATLWIQRGYSVGQVVPPAVDIAGLPHQLAAWTGQELPPDPRLQRFLQARSGVYRCYRHPTGREVLTHVVWTDDYIRINYPEQSYGESGWTKTDSESVEIKTAGEVYFPAVLLTFQREFEQIQVLYWFELGDEFFFDRVAHRALRRRVCWGQRQWPPLIKVMLQTPNSFADAGQQSLRDVAGHIYTWMHQKAGFDQMPIDPPPGENLPADATTTTPRSSNREAAAT
jgi:hypothetical protein